MVLFPPSFRARSLPYLRSTHDISSQWEYPCLIFWMSSYSLVIILRTLVCLYGTNDAVKMSLMNVNDSHVRHIKCIFYSIFFFVTPSFLRLCETVRHYYFNTSSERWNRVWLEQFAAAVTWTRFARSYVNKSRAMLNVRKKCCAADCSL